MTSADSSARLRETPLTPWHRNANARLVPFAGYEMPIEYESIVAEHRACRTDAVVFDVSHMGRLRFDGDGAEELLDRLLSRQVTDLPVGSVRYAVLCNQAGGILDDVLVSHLETPSQRRFHLMVVNASNREKILQWITTHLDDFPGVTLSDRTELTAMIAVQGPKAVETCRRLFKFDPARLKNYRTVVTEQFAKPVIVSRTGYTGEDGFELIVRAEEAQRIWENLMLCGRDRGFKAAGLGARDTLRMEAAMPLYGQELGETIDPISAGLRFACSLKTPREFIGRSAIEQVIQRGPERQRCGLLIDGKRPARQGCSVLNDSGKVIGKVTSGGPSPTLGRSIAMAYLDQDQLGATDLAVDIRGKTAAARRVDLPFYRRSS